MLDGGVNKNLLYVDATNSGQLSQNALKGSHIPYVGKAPSFDKQVVLTVRIQSVATPTVFHLAFNAEKVREVSYRFANGPTGAKTVYQTTVPVVKNAAHVDVALMPIDAEVLYITIKPASTTDLSMTVSNVLIQACLEPCKTQCRLPFFQIAFFIQV